ncbi:MAG: hypothetical protein ACTSSF_12540 [Candidatus Heimdallarchaeaceae archaeon]
MDKEKIEEVGKLTDVKANDMTKQKIRKKITLAYYSIIQLAFLAISSLVSSLFGFSKRTSGFYPYVTFDPNYIFGPIIVAIVQGGNFALSYRLRKTGRLVVRKGTDTVLSPFYTYTIVFLNFILSVLSFLFIYHSMRYTSAFSTTTRYGVYLRKKTPSNNFFGRIIYV